MWMQTLYVHPRKMFSFTLLFNIHLTLSLIKNTINLIGNMINMIYVKKICSIHTVKSTVIFLSIKLIICSNELITFLFMINQKL